MKVVFKLRFYTHPGQSLWLTGNYAVLGGGDPARALPLHYVSSEFWQAEVEFPDAAAPDAEIVYNYFLRNPDGSVTCDWGRDKTIDPTRFRPGEVLIVDWWNEPGFVENAFYTEPFTGVFLPARGGESRKTTSANGTHTFRAKSPLLAKGQVLCLLGSSSALGNWNTAAPVLMSKEAGAEFFSVELEPGPLPVEYKYGVYDAQARTFVEFEKGPNRVLSEGAGSNRHVIVNDGFARLPMVAWKGAGVAIPVFSLRTEKSFGVGEFTDLKVLADWCKRTGLKLIQLLPINDTTATHSWSDSYPYSCISAFAMHPLYLNLSEVAAGPNKTLLSKLEPERKRLNSLAALDYDSVMKAKLGFLKQIYPSQRAATFQSEAYQKFFAKNKHWLVPYAVYCHLRDEFGTADFHHWPKYQEYNPAQIEELATEGSPAYDSVAFHYFLQFQLHVQLKEAVEYAHSQGVVLKGDIPIGVARNGAETWQRRELFHLDMQAGAPPDMFTAKGQNWGFPTYNWQKMKADGFRWWRERMEQMGRYFDAFRIDHILGFFRIWSIPIDATDGMMGYFVPAIPLRPEEFLSRAIPFDYDRYTKPFVDDGVLSELFGDEAAFVKQEFVDTNRERWALKPEFATQRKVEAYFAAREKSESNERLKSLLCDLIGNVILFEDRNAPGQFHFRFAVEKTPSFKRLDGRVHEGILALYRDYFFRRQDAMWQNEAMEKLPALKRATNMLICGEDLGFVPACVPDVMRQLGLLSLEVQRMPKDSKREFFHPPNAPYLSVVTPSTHDMSTIREWWLEDRATTQKFFNHELNFPGEAPAECEPWISKAVIAQHLAASSMWSIFQLQDLLGMDGRLRVKNPADERINEPANPKHYWRYRMHLTLERLLEAEEFNDELRRLVVRYGRS
jgi:4-alpha-glucanotransferase